MNEDEKDAVIGIPGLACEIGRLIRTPVGWRLMRKVGGASALTIGDLAGCGDDGEGGPTPTPAPTATPTPTERPREVRHLSCALDSAVGAANLTLSVGGVEYPLESVTEAHLRELWALAACGRWRTRRGSPTSPEMSTCRRTARCSCP